jgi:DNA-binding transcriptional ArsR family regulator
MPKNNRDSGFDPNSDLADRLFYALSYPLRRRILRSLMERPASAKTLSDAYGLPLGNVSYHLGTVLFKTCGLIELVETNQRRGAAERVYGIKPEAYIGAVRWPGLPASLRSAVQGIAMSTFIASAVASLEAEPDKPERPGLFSVQPVPVDKKGHREIAAAIENLQTTVKSVAKRCSTVDDPADLFQLIVGSVVFEAAPRQWQRDG